MLSLCSRPEIKSKELMKNRRSKRITMMRYMKWCRICRSLRGFHELQIADLFQNKTFLIRDLVAFVTQIPTLRWYIGSLPSCCNDNLVGNMHLYQDSLHAKMRKDIKNIHKGNRISHKKSMELIKSLAYRVEDKEAPSPGGSDITSYYV